MTVDVRDLPPALRAAPTQSMTLAVDEHVAGVLVDVEYTVPVGQRSEKGERERAQLRRDRRSADVRR